MERKRRYCPISSGNGEGLRGQMELVFLVSGPCPVPRQTATVSKVPTESSNCPSPLFLLFVKLKKVPGPSAANRTMARRLWLKARFRSSATVPRPCSSSTRSDKGADLVRPGEVVCIHIVNTRLTHVIYGRTSAGNVLRGGGPRNYFSLVLNNCSTSPFRSNLPKLT